MFLAFSLTAFLLQCSGAIAPDGPGGRLGAVGPAGPPRVGQPADQVPGRRSHAEQAGGTAGSCRDLPSHRCQGTGITGLGFGKVLCSVADRTVCFWASQIRIC
jgi:hypothetical protein